MRRLATSKGKSYVSFYDYPTRARPRTPASVLFSHATGFHGRIFNKSISFLDPDWFSCYTFDSRGHGQSPWTEDDSKTVLDDWNGFRDDVLQMSAYIRRENPRSSLIGVGHSQGATSLLLAALEEPRRFNALILYEPVVWRDAIKLCSYFEESPLTIASRKKRCVEFDSHKQAMENFAKRPPMNSFHNDVLKDYVTYGLSQPVCKTEKCHLLCDPQIEARIYNSAHVQNIWNRLGHIKVPVWIVCGKDENHVVSEVAKSIHEQLPNSNFVAWDACNHFGPMQAPSKLSNLINWVRLKSPQHLS